MYSVEEGEEEEWEHTDSLLPSIHVSSSLEALPIPNASATHRTHSSSSLSSTEQSSPRHLSSTHTEFLSSHRAGKGKPLPQGAGAGVGAGAGTFAHDATLTPPEPVPDDLSSSLGGNSSVGSFSSLFSRSHRHYGHAKRPKNSLSKLKSSFIDRSMTNDFLLKTLASKPSQGDFLFFNVGMNFLWMDSHHEKVSEPLARLGFSKAYPTCHDINTLTSAQSEHMDILIGFSSGDFLWYDPISNRYSRFNKNGIINASAVTLLRWVPGSEDLFIAAFEDGTMLVMDKEKDDQPFHLPPSPQTWAEEQVNMHRFKVTKPYKHSKYNPVSHWRVSDKGILAFAFSPDGSHMAVVGKDGLLRTIDYHQEKMDDIYGSYYGRIQCVAWSPDGHYIITGGQDDLVTIWSFREQRIVARCQGHKSWVNGLAFDVWRCNDKVHRFASVGEDCNLILWDFSIHALHRPRQVNRLTGRSSSTELSALSKLRKRSSVGSNITSWAPLVEETNHTQLPTLHPPLNKTQVPLLQPVSIHTIHADPCVDVLFKKNCIYTTDRRGRVRKWDRPQ
ncbi:WD40-repeat-containing domain protein [Spinellus fusiger]|nr:WD40-repeat-containing domain protein [Spinellus fusiger]